MNCPKCGSDKFYYLTALDSYLCLKCHHQYSAVGEEE